MKQQIIDIAGWYGTIAIILAYALNSLSILGSNNIIYQLLNFSGALGIVGVSLSRKAYQPATLNIIWTIIALIAIIKIFTL